MLESDMRTLIDTPNLGPVKNSQVAIKSYCKHCDYDDLVKAKEDLVRIVQSQEIERLEIPASVGSQMSSQGDDPSAIEFWVHFDSSMVFTVIPKDGYKLVSLGIKQDMGGFLSI